MSELVLRENRDGAAILTLNRPEKLNALSKDMIEALEEHVDKLERETKTIGLVILRGANGNWNFTSIGGSSSTPANGQPAKPAAPSAGQPARSSTTPPRTS